VFALSEGPRELKSLVARLAEEMNHGDLEIAQFEHGLSNYCRHWFGATPASLDQIRFGFKDKVILAGMSSKPSQDTRHDSLTKPRCQPRRPPAVFGDGFPIAKI